MKFWDGIKENESTSFNSSYSSSSSGGKESIIAYICYLNC